MHYVTINKFDHARNLANCCDHNWLCNANIIPNIAWPNLFAHLSFMQGWKVDDDFTFTFKSSKHYSRTWMQI